MRFSVVCSPGVGDLIILHIVSHHLSTMRHEVTTVTPHHFGKWLEGYRFGELEKSDAIFLQHSNTERDRNLKKMENTYTFFGSHNVLKHGPLNPGFDFVADHNRTMVDNIVTCLKTLFGIEGSPDNGFRPPKGVVHRRYPKRIAIHTSSGNPFRNWPEEKFKTFARWAESKGFEPVFLSKFPSLEDLTSFIYESGYFLGNDSGPGHIASCLKIPHLIIGRDEKHMRHWRPGWSRGIIMTPPRWIPNWKGFRIREKFWSSFISSRSVINCFNDMVL